MKKSTSLSACWSSVLVAFLLAENAMAALILVGDSLGWTNFDLSTQRVPDYAAWAASQPVESGDSLVFRYAPGFHNVAMLPSKTDFDHCNFAKATILDTGASGNFTWIAPQKTGVYYFACGVSVEGQGTHCDGGQKVSITLGASAPPPLALSPTPEGLVLAPSSSPEPSAGADNVPLPPPESGVVPVTPMVEPGVPSASVAAPIQGSADQDSNSGGSSVVNFCWTSVVALSALPLFL